MRPFSEWYLDYNVSTLYLLEKWCEGNNIKYNIFLSNARKIVKCYKIVILLGSVLVIDIS